MHEHSVGRSVFGVGGAPQSNKKTESVSRGNQR